MSNGGRESHTEVEKMSLAVRDDAIGAGTRVHSYMVAVTRKNLGEFEEGKKWGLFSEPLINVVLPLNLRRLMTLHLHVFLWKITALQGRWEAADHVYEVQPASLMPTEVSTF